MSTNISTEAKRSGEIFVLQRKDPSASLGMKRKAV